MMDWVQSYLTGQFISVLVSGNYSEPAVFMYGVSQRSMLAAKLFSDYSSAVA